MRYELIAFDWDGTLFDSTACIVKSIQAAAREMGLAEPPVERARHVIGLGLEPALQSLIGSLRAEGEIVIQNLPGHERDHQEFDCDREIVADQGQFIIKPLR